MQIASFYSDPAIREATRNELGLDELGFDDSYFESKPDPVLRQIGKAVKNWWYKNTGQSHLTDEYKHEEELANTAYQRAAADMEAAGLSKFGGVNPASSPSPKSGNGMLSTLLTLENLKGARLANKVEKYNYDKAKQWGVPTSAVNDFAKYDAISKMLFGKPLTDMIGDDGLVGLLRGLFPSSDQPGDPVDAVVGGAASDGIQSVLKSDVPLSDVPGSDVPGFAQFFVRPTYLGKNKSLENVLVPKPVFFGSPESISALKASLADKISYSPTNVMRSSDPYFESHIVNDVDRAAKKMLNDNKLDDDNINRFSELIAKHYGYDMMEVRKLFDDWLAENKGEVIYRW